MYATRKPCWRRTLLSSRLPRVAGASGVAAFAGLLGSFGAGASSFAGAEGAGLVSCGVGSGAFFCSGCVSGVGSLGVSLASAGLSPEGAPPSSMRTRS
jgi:hypothetical protein